MQSEWLCQSEYKKRLRKQLSDQTVHRCAALTSFLVSYIYNHCTIQKFVIILQFLVPQWKWKFEYWFQVIPLCVSECSFRWNIQCPDLHIHQDDSRIQRIHFFVLPTYHMRYDLAKICCISFFELLMNFRLN